MLIAAVLVQLAFMQPSAAAAADLVWLESCVDSIATDPNAAYEAGMAWSDAHRRPEGWRCAAMALVELGRTAEGARRLEALGNSPQYGTSGWRAEVMSQAGNAWLLSGDGASAQRALTSALTLMGDDPDVVPDLLIDRSQAYALTENWRAAEEDLNRALDMRGSDPVAFRLRAIARMNQRAFDLAVADAERAVALAPSDVDGLLVLGAMREAQRTGAPVVTGPAVAVPSN